MTESREPQVAGSAAPRPEPATSNSVSTAAPENGLAPGQPLSRARYSRVLLKLARTGL